jgi:hypothetical protein
MEAKILRLGATQRDVVAERRRQSVRDARVAGRGEADVGVGRAGTRVTETRQRADA